MLGDPTRLRLLALLETEELTVAELAETMRLAQPRVSTHLGKLRDAGLVADRREGVSVYYRSMTDGQDTELSQIWSLVSSRLDDPVIAADAERLPDVLAQRARGRSWPDAVAGDMERHYSPGRSWEATTRALVQLIAPGKVLDIASGDGVMGELLGPRAESVDCVDLSPKVVEAGQARVRSIENVRFHQGDMHALPFDDATFDTVLLLHALTYSDRPEAAAREAARVLRTGGALIAAALKSHRHTRQVEAYGHVNNGFSPRALRRLFGDAGLEVDYCDVTSVEKKPPNFEIITLLARRT